MIVNPTTPRSMKVAYEAGYGVADLIALTGKSYEEVRNALGETGATLVTGGPHDTQTCRHNHGLAALHASGTCLHTVTARKRTMAERRALAVSHG